MFMDGQIVGKTCAGIAPLLRCAVKLRRCVHFKNGLFWTKLKGGSVSRRRRHISWFAIAPMAKPDAIASTRRGAMGVDGCRLTTSSPACASLLCAWVTVAALPGRGASCGRARLFCDRPVAERRSPLGPQSRDRSLT